MGEIKEAANGYVGPLSNDEVLRSLQFPAIDEHLFHTEQSTAIANAIINRSGMEPPAAVDFRSPKGMSRMTDYIQHVANVFRFDKSGNSNQRFTIANQLQIESKPFPNGAHRDCRLPAFITFMQLASKMNTGHLCVTIDPKSVHPSLFYTDRDTITHKIDYYDTPPLGKSALFKVEQASAPVGLVVCEQREHQTNMETLYDYDLYSLIGSGLKLVQIEGTTMQNLAILKALSTRFVDRNKTSTLLPITQKLERLLKTIEGYINKPS